MTKKEEAQAKREEKLRLERERVAGMRSFEREAVGTLLGGIMLPEGFLQRRIVNFSYAAFANMIRQRRNHRLPQWRYFLSTTFYALPMQEFLPPLTAEKGKE